VWTEWIDVGILAVLVAGIVFTWFQLRGMRRTRDADLLTHLTMLWESEPLKGAREAVHACTPSLAQELEQSSQQDIPKFIKLLTVSNYFETIGLLVRLHCLGHKAAKELFGTVVWEYYILYDPYIKAHRGEDPEIYIHFEQLMKNTLTK